MNRPGTLFGVVATSLVVLSLVACASDGDSANTDPTEGDEVCPSFAADLDAIVYFDPDGSEDADSIEAQAAAVEGVETVTGSTPGEAWNDLQAALGNPGDSAEMPDYFPPSLGVVFDDTADWRAVRDEVVGFGWYGGGYVRTGPDEGFEVEAGRWDDADFVIFFPPEVAPADIDAVVADVESNADVVSSRYLDQVAAYEEFSESFADRPELIATVSPEILPSSLRVLAADLEAEAIEDLAESYVDAAGVLEVVVAPTSVVGSRALTEALSAC